jgi:TonB family protein
MIALLAALLLASGSVTVAGEADPYATAIYHAIKAHWSVPANKKLASNLEAVVRVRIGEDGTLVGPELRKSSGDPAFDEACLAAVTATAKVPPPPTAERARWRRGMMLTFDARSLAEPDRDAGAPAKGPPQSEAPDEQFLPPEIGRAQAEKQDLPRVSALKLAAGQFALFKVCVSAAGKPTMVAVLKGGGPALDRAAQADLTKWTYRPYLIAGQPVPFCYAVRVPKPL